MASKRNLRKKSCDGKRKLDLEKARNTARFLAYRTHDSIGFYKCQFCKCYHIGHTPKAIKKVIAERIANQTI